MSEQLQMLDLEKLQESKYNPRKHFDKETLTELAESIKQNGMVEPLIIRPIPQGGIGTDRDYEIVAGARRFRALKLTGAKTCLCVVRELTDDQALEIQIIENLQRDDVHPLEEAEGYKRLLGRGKHTVASLAGKIGKSEAYVYQRLKLCDLIPVARTMFLQDEFSLSHALILCRQTAAQQKELLKNDPGQHTAEDFRDLTRREFHLALKAAAFNLEDINLVPKAGACVNCLKRTGANPNLFPDIKQTDICTDPTCFNEKAIAFVKIQVGTHPDAVLLSGGSQYHYSAYGDKSKPKGLTPDQWTFAGTKKCDHIQQGVIVEMRGRDDDDSKGKLGQLATVCTKYATCTVHNEWARSRSELHERRQTKAVKEKRRNLRFTKRVNQEIYRRLIASFKKAVNLEELRPVAIEVAEENSFRYRAEWLATALDVPFKREKSPSATGSNAQNAIEKFVAKAHHQDLLVFLAAVPFTPGFYGDAEDDWNVMRKRAVSRGIKLAEVEKEVLAQDRAKKVVQKDAKKKKK